MAPSLTIQAMDVTSLRAVLAELRPALIPSRFEKAQQVDAHTVQLGLRGLNSSHWLELSWLAEAPRLLAIPQPPRQGDGSTLAQQLQHSLRNLALVSIDQQGWERVVELGFARRPGEAAQRFLVLELMGRHSNLFLLDEHRRVVALGRQIRQDQSRIRPIGTGDSYRPPPAPAGDAPHLDEPEATWRRRLSLLPLPLPQALMGTYRGIGPAQALQLTTAITPGGPSPLVSELTPEQWQLLRSHWQSWLQAVEREDFRLLWGGASDFRCWIGPASPSATAPSPPATIKDTAGAGSCSSDVDRLPINSGLARYYGSRLAQRRLEQLRHGLRQRLLGATAREERNVAQQQSLLAAVPGSDDLQHRADQLLSQRCPSREQIDEAQKLYRQARKLRRSVASITPRLELHRQRLDLLETSLIFLEQAESLAELQALQQEVQDLLALRPGAQAHGSSRGGTSKSSSSRNRTSRPGEAARHGPKAAAGLPQPLELRSAGGLRLQVGRNHRQNEWISLRQARHGDLWFHAQECPGSHVVLKASEGTPEEGDLEAAADLAAHFSRGRGNNRVPVVMVPTDDLQRIPGAGPGTVRHRGGAILWGEPGRALVLLDRS